MKKQKVKILKCTCCGRREAGRQWFNQDAGTGICGKCVAWQRDDLGYSEETIHDYYGVSGYNYDLEVLG